MKYGGRILKGLEDSNKVTILSLSSDSVIMFDQGCSIPKLIVDLSSGLLSGGDS